MTEFTVDDLICLNKRAIVLSGGEVVFDGIVLKLK